MLLKIKLFLIVSLYVLGALFMLFFPPRNFVMSGAKVRSLRSVGTSNLQFQHYLSNRDVFNIASSLTISDPDVVRLVQLKPQTSLNRTLVALELQSDKNSKKPGLLIIGALDPMIWGAPIAILELAQKLLHDSNYQTPFFNDYDWYLLPLTNPDGLELTLSLRKYPSIDSAEWSRNHSTHSQARPTEWHKNVQNSETKTCFGTNINRNFAYHWQDDMSKLPDLCSQYYPGNKPFSTLEAKAIKTYVDSLGDKIHMAVHLDGNYIVKKELILYPWLYSKRLNSNYRSLQNIGEYAARQARLPNGRLYEVHQGSTDGRVSGTLSDYLSGVVGTELVYTVKPFHEKYPNYTDHAARELYVKKSISVIMSLVRGWRSNTKQNTLSFFGRDVDF